LGGGGVALPPDPDEGTVVSSKLGSPPSRDLGGDSTVELRVGPVPGRDGTVAEAAGESESEYPGTDGTELVGAVAGPSVVTVVPDPQLVQGVVACAGEV